MERWIRGFRRAIAFTEQTDIPIENIQQYRRNFRVIKEMYFTIKGGNQQVVASTDNDLLHKANRPFFNDVNDHLQFVVPKL